MGSPGAHFVSKLKRTKGLTHENVANSTTVWKPLVDFTWNDPFVKCQIEYV